MNDWALHEIEQSYGSVAEYNRSMKEAEQNRYWNSLSDAEQEWENIESNLFGQKNEEMAEALRIPASEFAVARVKQYQEQAQGLENNLVKIDAYRNAMIEDIAEKYGVSFHDTSSDFRKTAPGQFCIAYEMLSENPIHSRYSDAMDKDTFMQLMADMQCTCRTTVSCNGQFINTGSDIGWFRLTEFYLLGIDDAEEQAIIQPIKDKYDALIEKKKEAFFKWKPAQERDEYDDWPTAREWFEARFPEVFEKHYLSNDDVDISYQGSVVGHIHFTGDESRCELNVYPGKSEVFKEYLQDMECCDVKVSTLSIQHMPKEMAAAAREMKTDDEKLQLVQMGYMLDELMYDESETVRTAVAGTGYRLERTVFDPSPEVRKATAECAVLFQNWEAVEQLKHDENAEVRASIASFVSEWDIQSFLGDEDRSVREAAVLNLSQRVYSYIKSEASPRTLFERFDFKTLTDDESALVRQEALRMISADFNYFSRLYGEAEVLGVYNKLAKDENPDVRKMAKHFMKKELSDKDGFDR